MAAYKLIALTNCLEGHETEFNTWYDNTHVREARTVPGVISSARYEIAGRLGVSGVAENPGYEYVAIYDVETDDPQAFMATMEEFVAAGKIARGTLYRPPMWVALYKAR